MCNVNVIMCTMCSESWGMGAEGFRRAPMMHEKLTTLTRTELNPKHTRRIYN
jgi:hypothetical protein